MISARRVRRFVNKAANIVSVIALKCTISARSHCVRRSCGGGSLSAQATDGALFECSDCIAVRLGGEQGEFSAKAKHTQTRWILSLTRFSALEREKFWIRKTQKTEKKSPEESFETKKFIRNAYRNAETLLFYTESLGPGAFRKAPAKPSGRRSTRSSSLDSRLSNTVEGFRVRRSLEIFGFI